MYTHTLETPLSDIICQFIKVDTGDKQQHVTGKEREGGERPLGGCFSSRALEGLPSSRLQICPVCLDMRSATGVLSHTHFLSSIIEGGGEHVTRAKQQHRISAFSFAKSPHQRKHKIFTIFLLRRLVVVVVEAQPDQGLVSLTHHTNQNVACV